MRRLAVSTALFDGYPLETAIAEIAAAGVAYVEPAFTQGYIDFTEADFTTDAATRLALLMKNAGVSCFAVSAHTDIGLDGSVAAMERRLWFAAALGATFLITNTTTRSQEDAFWRNMSGIAHICEAAGIVLALENPGHGADSLLPDGEAGAAIVRRIGSPHVGLNYDFGNIYTYNNERQAAADFRVAAPYTVHAHFKDILASADDWDFCAIGEGSVDYASVGRVLAETPADVPVSLELPLRLSRKGRRAPQRAPAPVPLTQARAALRRSVAFVRTLPLFAPATRETS